MPNRETRISCVTTVPGVEVLKRLRCKSRQNPSNGIQTGHVGTDAQEEFTLPRADKLEPDASVRVLANQVVSEEPPTNNETEAVVPLTSKELFVRDVVAAIPVYLEGRTNKLVLETPKTTQKGVHKRLSAALMHLVLRIVQKVVNAPEFIKQF